MNWFYKQQLDLPSWIKPELTSIAYWVHLAILGFVVLGILQLIYSGNLLSIKNLLLSLPLLAIGDFFGHTITRLD